MGSDPSRLTVTAVRGRWPSQPRVFRAAAIETEVTEAEPGKFSIHLDDSDNPVFWLELHLTVGPKEGGPCPKAS